MSSIGQSAAKLLKIVEERSETKRKWAILLLKI